MTPDEGLYLELTEDDFKAMPPDRQLCTIFRVLQHTAGHLDSINKDGCQRYKSEARKVGIMSAAWGVLGGFLAGLGKGKFW